tara:strand:- start:185 stop:304 length:120 start_codon:yes stop_codon:yes gene_type:complete
MSIKVKTAKKILKIKTSAQYNLNVSAVLTPSGPVKTKIK